MSQLTTKPELPEDLEPVFSAHENDPEALLIAFMPVFCDHVNADRMFVQPRNPDTRICKVLRCGVEARIFHSIPGNIKPNEWFVEDLWEVEDPLWRAALNLKPSIYIEDLQKAAEEGLLNIEFENNYMFHTAFIHAHAHSPPLPPNGGETNVAAKGRKFYGSVQPAVFDGPRVWGPEIHELVDKCVERLAPVMKTLGESAPSLASFGNA